MANPTVTPVSSRHPGRSELVLAVDCSTTAAKAVLVGADGEPAGSSAAPIPLYRPAPGQHEQDADDWWTATRTAIRGALAQIGAASSVAAICITHQRESFVCLDAAGTPVRRAILWLDSRADAEIAELGSPAVHALSGKPPDVTPALYKLAWLRRHEPQTLHRAAVVTEVHGYLVHRLTGQWVTSIGSADSLGLLDLAAGDWSPQLLALAGVRADQLPRLVPPGVPAATLAPAAAQALGLPAGLPVIAGIGDGQAAGLGAGVRPGDGTGYLNLGTSMVLGVPTPDYVTSPAFRTLAGARAGSFVLETVLNAAAYLTDWFRRELGDPARGERPDPELEAAAAAVPPGADGLLTLPYWNCVQTPHWDGAARGAMVGWHGGHTRAHAYRSLLEGVAFELRLHLDGLEAASGTVVRELRAMGGGSRSALWTQLVADITRRPVQHVDLEASALGAAVLAWSGLGHPDLPRAPAPSRTVAPRPEQATRYDALYAVHSQLYPALREVFAGLGAVR